MINGHSFILIRQMAALVKRGMHCPSASIVCTVITKSYCARPIQVFQQSEGTCYYVPLCNESGGIKLSCYPFISPSIPCH